jgi:hypothetical protein
MRIGIMMVAIFALGSAASAEAPDRPTAAILASGPDHHFERLALVHGAVAVGTASRSTVRSKTRPGSIRPSITSGRSASI